LTLLVVFSLGHDGSVHAPEIEFEYEISDTEVLIKSKISNNTHEDSLKYRLYGGDHPHLEAKLKTEVNDVEKEFEFEIEFKKIFEYQPSGTTLEYDEFKDTIIHELDDFEIEKIIDLTPTSNVSKQFKMTAKDGFFSAIIKIKVKEPTAISFNPDDVKIDIAINSTALREMGWLVNLTNRIGLKVLVKTEVEVETDDDDEPLNVSDLEASLHLPLTTSNTGFFTWVNFLECNNGSSKIDIKTSKVKLETDPLETERSFKVFFSLIPGGGSDWDATGFCIWDPVIGFAENPASTTNSVVNLMVSAMLIVAFLMF